jgi:hypothetical protein
VAAPGRAKTAVLGVVLLVALVGAAGWSSLRKSVDRPAGWIDAPKVAGPAVRLRPAAGALASYRVTYRVDAGVPLGKVVRTEVLEVVRPWQSRLTTKSGPPPGKATTDVQTSDFGKLEVHGTGQAQSVLVVQPDLAALDLRLDVDLAALKRAGALEVRERRRVAGRDCQVYRTVVPPQGQSLTKMSAKSADDVVDTCVDGDGIVLEQLQRFKDTLLLRRRAVKVDLAPGIPAGSLDVSLPSTDPAKFGGGGVAAIDGATATTTGPGIFYVLDQAPAGFSFRGRYAVAPSVPPNSQDLPQANRRAGFVDVWVNGPDVLLLDQGGMTFGGDALGALPLGTKVEVTGFGPVQAAPGARLSQVAFARADGGYVRLQATLPVARLLQLLPSLRKVEAGS